MVLDSIMPHLSNSTPNSDSKDRNKLIEQEPPNSMSPHDQFKIKNMKNCLCWGRTKKASNTLITCTNKGCGITYHHSCMPWPPRELRSFECPRCIILNNDPLN